MAFPRCCSLLLFGGLQDEDQKLCNAIKLCIVAIVLINLVLSAPATAATLNVDGADNTCSDGTGVPFCTIQAAIDAAAAADEVLVMPGTYQENLDFKGKEITVRSLQGAAVTIIDGGAADTVAYFGTGETLATVLDGFTLQNGFAGPGSLASTGRGGGIYILGASPTIKNNVITDNVADLPGFGIEIQNGSPVIDGNTISNNGSSNCCTGGSGGGGISIGGADSGSAQIINNTIINNSVRPGFLGAGGIDLNSAGNVTIRNNYISGNRGGRGGGIGMINASTPLIVQNVIVNNLASDAGGGIYWLVPSSVVGPKVVNNTIAYNESPLGSGVLADGYDESTELTNNLIIAGSTQAALRCGDFNDLNSPILNSNNIYSAEGSAYAGICEDQTGSDGNISVDPQFVDTDAADYRVNPGSLSINAGDSSDPNLPAADFAGNARISGDSVDVGAYEFSPNPGTIEFTATSFTVRESDAAVTITVKREAGNSGIVTVTCSTSDGTAVADSDYTAVSNIITFADGDFEDKSITVPILNDGVAESYEDFNLVLSNPTGGATLTSDDTAEVVIQDNDYIPLPFQLEESGGCFIMTANTGGTMQGEDNK